MKKRADCADAQNNYREQPLFAQDVKNLILCYSKILYSFQKKKMKVRRNKSGFFFQDLCI